MQKWGFAIFYLKGGAADWRGALGICSSQKLSHLQETNQRISSPRKWKSRHHHHWLHTTHIFISKDHHECIFSSYFWVNLLFNRQNQSNFKIWRYPDFSAKNVAKKLQLPACVGSISSMQRLSQGARRACSDSLKPDLEMHISCPFGICILSTAQRWRERRERR